NTAPTSSDATFDMLLVDSTQTFDLAPVIGDAETPVGSLQIVIVSAPTYLTLTQSGTSFSVTPIDSTGHNGNDSFTYKVVDSNGAESPVSTVTILNVSDI
ncbi:MAG: Ig-like domain-containing protein, partial [Candidatus Gracilibacteria bacterium]|nr:Ig-like domain-containing protein [Candidatus Gracilibacteria bacterium]